MLWVIWGMLVLDRGIMGDERRSGVTNRVKEEKKRRSCRNNVDEWSMSKVYNIHSSLYGVTMGLHHKGRLLGRFWKVLYVTICAMYVAF